jgi:tetratricopeptide (TPR) repeat protein
MTSYASPEQPVPEATERLLRQAAVHHQSGRLSEAGELYRTILQSQPKHAEANYGLGMLALLENQPAASLPYFMTALDADPARGQYWISYIDALFQAGQLEDARQILALARQQGLEGDDVEALALRLEEGAPSSVPPSAESQPALEASPPVSSAQPQAGHKNLMTKPTLHEINTLIASFDQGKLTEAAALAQSLTERFPLHEFGWKALGAVCLQTGRIADALEPLQKAAALSPEDAEAHYSLGATFYNVGRLNEAEACFRHALKIRPDFAAVHNNLGGTLQALNRLGEAEASYRRALEINPHYADAHFNLGNILKDRGRLNEAEACFRRALDIQPDYADAHYNLGNILKELDRPDEAESCFRQALQIQPDYADAHYNLGNILRELGRLDEAEACYRRVIQLQPDYADAHYNLGNIFKELNRLDDAEGCYQQALQIQPDYAEAYSNLGLTLQALGRLDEAETRYRQALQIHPDDGDTYGNLGATLQALGRLDEAVTCCRRALQIQPDDAEVHNNLGAILQELGHLNEAEAHCRRALQIKPDGAKAHNNLGTILQELGRLDEAEACFRQALQINPNYAKAHNNLGITLHSMSRLNEAETCYRRVLQIEPDYAEAHHNLSFILLETGRLAEGWPEYEYRWETNAPKSLRPANPLPQWTGQAPLPGDRLLVTLEQGMGDQLQFSRYLPLAANRFAAGVSIFVGRPLLALFRRSFPEIEILDAPPDNQDAWQWQCPLLSLPLAFGTTLETIPNHVPYLIPNPTRVSGWRSKIAALDLPAFSRKIGVVWKPGSLMKNAPLRALTLQQLSPLLNLPDCTWFSLQKEPDPDKAPWVNSGKLIDWSIEFSDFDETAALLMNMDLIVSVDTSVAHLAGGLGQTVWLLNRHDSEWRWMRNREDSPWYPTMRIFTQKQSGDWDEVLMRLATMLSGMPL